MFRDKSFTIAFFISLAWHLLLIVTVTVIILPVRMSTTQYVKVSFLGPILERTAFDILFETRARLSQTQYGQGAPHSGPGAELYMPELSRVRLQARPYAVPLKEQFIAKLKHFFIRFKKTPRYKLKVDEPHNPR